MTDLKETYLVKVYKNIEANKHKINKKDFRFFQLDLLLELARKSQIFSSECEICLQNKDIIFAISENYPEKINTIEGRKSLTSQLDNIFKHLRKKHKVYTKGYLVSIWSFFGILTGTILGGIIGFFLKNITSFLLAGFVLGMFAGRIYGRIKENKAQENGKIISPKIVSMIENILNKQKNQTM